MWENIADSGSSQMTVWLVRIARWITKATDTHSEYVMFIAFPVQQWLHERSPVLRCTYIACLVQISQIRVTPVFRVSKLIIYIYIYIFKFKTRPFYLTGLLLLSNHHHH